MAFLKNVLLSLVLFPIGDWYILAFLWECKFDIIQYSNVAVPEIISRDQQLVKNRYKLLIFIFSVLYQLIPS